MSASDKKKRKSSIVLTDAVLESAEKLFENIGFKKTTTNKIANLAGVSIGSIYQYFLNKEAILSILIDRMLRNNRTLFIENLKNYNSSSIEDSIKYILDVSLKQFFDRKDFLKIFFSQIHKLNKMDQVYAARKVLAKEMSEILICKFPESVDQSSLEKNLYLLFNSYVGALEAYVSENAEPISEDSLRTHVYNLALEQILKKPSQN